MFFPYLPALGTGFLPPTVHPAHYTQIAIQGLIGLALIKITALVVVFASLLTGGLLVKLFSLGLIFGASKFNQPVIHLTRYRSISEPRFDMVKTLFKIMMEDTDTCKKKLICLLQNKAIQSPLLESAFYFLMCCSNIWKFSTEDDSIRVDNCNKIYYECENSLILSEEQTSSSF